VAEIRCYKVLLIYAAGDVTQAKAFHMKEFPVQTVRCVGVPQSIFFFIIVKICLAVVTLSSSLCDQSRREGHKAEPARPVGEGSDSRRAEQFCCDGCQYE
jgi:hypothetical protein